MTFIRNRIQLKLSDKNPKRGIEFHQSTRNVSKNSEENGKRGVLGLDSLCLPSYIRNIP